MTFVNAVVAWARKWRWVLLMNAYLISPVLLYEVRLRDKTAPFTLAASVLWLVAAQLVARRAWIAHTLMLPLYVVVGADLYIISNYQTRLASNMLLTIAENMDDAVAFIESDAVRTIGGLIILLAGYAFCLRKIRPLRVTTPRWLVAAPLVALAVVYLGVHRYLGDWPTVLFTDRDSPFGVFPQTYITIALHRQEVHDRERAASFHFGATRPDAPAEPETYVLVVGESARRHNWSVYGYARDTNPRLEHEENVVVFPDVLTQVTVTRVSVPLIITRGSIMEPERAAKEKSIVTVFGEVGFSTYWLSTQQREADMSAINFHANEAETVRFFDHRYDGVLVDTMRDMLAASNGTGDKSFFLLHTLGSHFNLTSRYPREFARFPDGGQSMLGGASSTMTRAELMGAYDNSILYTDHVLGELIDLLKQRPGMKALLYVPDHGDNLRDDSRDLWGHAHSNEYDVPIPMIFWYSKEYEARFPDKVRNLLRNATRPLNTRTVFYSLTDMAGIHIDDPELPRVSVFSADFTPWTRYVFAEPHPFDFDEWMARTGTTIPKVVPPN